MEDSNWLLYCIIEVDSFEYFRSYRIELVALPGNSNKEMNLLYVLQEDLVLSEDLKGSIGFFELSGERVKLRSMIGKGAFGEVYIGQAQGVNESPDWTTVAIKTLAGAAPVPLLIFLIRYIFILSFEQSKQKSLKVITF